jgi:opacity protein-like surface antigen
MNRLTSSVISATALMVVAGMTSNVNANGTVKADCPPVRHHHHHKHHKHHHHHKPHCPIACPVLPACPPCLYHTGFYGGALIGWSRMDASIKDHFQTTDPVLLSSTLSKKKHSDSVIGELQVGWRYLFRNNFTTGIEVAGTVDDSSIKARLTHLGGPDAQIKYKRQYAAIPSLTFGKVFCCNWHGFIKLGVGLSRFKTKFTNLDVGGPSFTKKKTKAGFVPALGLEYAFNQHVSFIGTAAYEWYERVNSGFINTVPPVPAGAFSNDKVKVKTRFFNLKVGALFKV